MPLQEILTTFIAFATGVGVLVPLCWNTYWFMQLEKANAKIRVAEDEYDAVEPDIVARTTGHLVTQGQAEKMIEANRKSISRKLERLKQERDFIKDKLLFIKK